MANLTADAENSLISPRHYHEIPSNSQSQDTPLLHNPHRRWHFGGKIALTCLVLLLIIGVAIGVYLLCIEDEPALPERFFLVPRGKWSPKPEISPDISSSFLPIEKVLFLLTNTSGCWSSSECLTELINLQKQHVNDLKEPDILYNFIVAGDGRIYEGRGWDYESSYLDDGRAPLTIAFLGRYDDVPPSVKQNQQLRTFLDYAVMQRNLIPCFKILVHNIPTRYIVDIAFEIEEKRDDYRCRQ